MSLSDLASLGSFISGVAVVFSFVFLALQMRQLNVNQKSLMQQGRSARSVELFSKMADPYISGVMVRSAMMDDSLKSTEVQSLMRLIGSAFLSYEDSFLQYRAGTLDAAVWETDVATLRAMLADPGTRVIWRMGRSLTGGAYRDYLDNLMAETKAAPFPDFAETWKTLMAEERAAL